MPPLTAYLYRDGPPRLRPLMGGADVYLTLPDSFTIGVTQPGPGQPIGAVESRLANYGGSFVPTANTIYRDLAFTSLIDIGSVPGVEFDNCGFFPNAATRAARGIVSGNNVGATGLKLTRCTLRPSVVSNSDGSITSNQLTGVYARDFTAERCDVSNVTDGFATQGRAVLLGNYSHDLAYMAASYQSDGVTHNDGFQVFGGDGSIVRGNFFDMRPGPMSDRSAPSTSSTGGIGQSIALTPTAATITNFLAELNWFDYGFRGIGGAGSAHPGGSITLQLNRFGPNIAVFPVVGYGSLRRPICVDPNLNLLGLPASGLGVTDTNNGNVNFDGTPIAVYRQIP